MAVTTFDTGRGKVTVKDVIARAAFLGNHAAHRAADGVRALKLDRAFAELRAMQARRETERQLGRLPDSLLQDIGLERADIHRMVRRY